MDDPTTGTPGAPMPEPPQQPPVGGDEPAPYQPQPAPQGSPEATLTVARTDGGVISGNWYNRIAQIAVYLAVFLIPLFYLPFTSSALELNKQILLVILAGVALVVWLLGVVVSGTMALRLSPLDKGVLALMVGVGVTTATSLSSLKSLFGLNVSLSDAFITILALGLLYFVAVNVFHDRGRLLRRTLILSGTVALVLGVMQMFTAYILPGGFTHSRAFNTIGSLNALGVLGAVLLPLFAKGTAKLWGKGGLIVSWVGVVTALFVLIILNWWVLWAIALAGMLAMIGFDSLNTVQLSADYGGRERKRFALSRFIVPMAVIVLGAFLLLVKFDLSFVKSQFPVEIAPSHSLSWRVAEGVLGQDFIFGYGPENFSLAFDRFGAGELANTRLSNLRFFDGTSQMWSWLVHGGVVMMLALGVLIWSLIQVVARLGDALASRLGAKDGGSEAVEASGVLSATVAMTAALFLYPFNIALMGVWFFLLALSALVVAGDKAMFIDIEQKPVFSLSASLGFIVGLIIALTGVYFVTVNYLADAAYARGGTRETASEALEDIARALSLNDQNDRYYRDASQLSLQVLRVELQAPADDGDTQRPARVQNLIASAVQLAQRATDMQAQESLNWANLAAVYQALTGLVDNVEQLAEENYAKASELRPGDPTFDNRVGSMWLARSDLIRRVAVNASVDNRTALAQQSADSLERAEAAFTRALEKSPSFGSAIYNRAAVYDRQNRVKEAIADLEQIIPANANNATLMFELGILYLRDDRKDDANAAMQRAVLLSPQYANARWYLGLLMEERGDIEGALGNFRAILNNNPDNEVLLQKISQLQSGGDAVAEEEVIDQVPLDDTVDPEPVTE